VAVVGARLAFAGGGSGAPQATLYRLLGLTAVALCLLALARHGVLLYGLGAALLGASAGLAYPLVQAQAVNHAPPHLRAQVLILFSLCYLVPRYLFPYAVALLVEHGGYVLLNGVLLMLALAQLPLAQAAFRSTATGPMAPQRAAVPAGGRTPG
jgi:MFS family permease